MATESVGWSNVTNGAGTQNRQSKPPVDPSDALANKDTFLQLLVAQIRNQNPLAPQDGTQFLSQLAQFSSLEQFMAMRKDLGALRESVEQIRAVLAKPESTTSNPA